MCSFECSISIIIFHVAEETVEKPRRRRKVLSLIAIQNLKNVVVVGWDRSRIFAIIEKNRSEQCSSPLLSLPNEIHTIKSSSSDWKTFRAITTATGKVCFLHQVSDRPVSKWEVKFVLNEHYRSVKCRFMSLGVLFGLLLSLGAIVPIVVVWQLSSKGSFWISPNFERVFCLASKTTTTTSVTSVWKRKFILSLFLCTHHRLLVECSHWFIELFTIRLNSHRFMQPLFLRGTSHLQLQYDPRGAFVDDHCSANRKHHLSQCLHYLFAHSEFDLHDY